MAKKSKKRARAQSKAQKAAAQRRDRAMPPGPVALECRDESGRPIPAICYPPDPRYVLERGRWRQRFYSPRWREARALHIGLDLGAGPDRTATVVIDGDTLEIIEIDGNVQLDAMRRAARRSAGRAG